jgi:hypothetical protein
MGLAGRPAYSASSGRVQPGHGEGVNVMAVGQPGQHTEVVLRRQPTSIIDGRPEGGYTDSFEIICCDCSDDPSLDYREVSPRLQLVRGPYPVAMGIAAYEEHIESHEKGSRGE